MPKATLEIKGKTRTWAITADMSEEQIEAMREDDVDVGILCNSMPGWIYNAGLANIWMFFQDIWNFKNPLK